MEIYRGEFERTSSHWWWRPGWNEDSRYYTFHLTFGAEPSVAEIARLCSPVLEPMKNVGPVPEPWLHLTMTGIGFVPDVPEEVLTELSERVLTTAVDQIDDCSELVFETVFLGSEGVMLTGPTPDWLAELKRAQERAVDDLLGPREWGGFWPHTSLAYFSGEIDEGALVAGLNEAGLADVVVTRPTVSLLELRRESKLYAWNTVSELTLEL